MTVLFSLAVLLGAPPFPAGDCPLSVDLAGEGRIVTEVAQELLARGIRVASIPGCRSVQALVVADELGVGVRVGTAQSPRRSAPDHHFAATLIEAYLREDVVAPLLRSSVAEPRNEVPRPARQPVAPASTSTPPSPPVSAPESRTLAIRMGAVFGGAIDGSAWTGFDAEVCLHLGGACFGGRLQYAADLGVSGDARSLSGNRSLLDVQLVAELPLGWEGLELTPGMGVGISIFRTGRVFEGEILDDDANGLRLRLQLAARVPLSRSFAVRAVVAGDYAPFARGVLTDTQRGDVGPVVNLAGEPVVVGWLKFGVELAGL